VPVKTTAALKAKNRTKRRHFIGILSFKGPKQLG
jgi:hypothetical protein